MERRSNFLMFEAQSKAGVGLVFFGALDMCIRIPDPVVCLLLASTAGLTALGFEYSAWQDVETDLFFSRKSLKTEF